MAREVLVSLDSALFPGIDPDDPPHDIAGWIRHYCHGDEGALRLRDLLRSLGDRGFEPAQRKRLQECFAATEPRITEDQLDKFLYQPRPLRLGKERLELITRYLWDAGLLPGGNAPRKTFPDVIKHLHEGLVGFLDVAESSIEELNERLPGRYWIYRPSLDAPGQYVRGLLTVHVRDERGSPLAASEDYRMPGDALTGAYGLRETYEGLALQKSHHPLMLCSLKVPTRRDKPPGELQHADVAALRVTLIASARMHADGKITSMLGLAAASHVSIGLLASAVCFERIPPDYPGAPEEELGIVAADQVPSAVLGRLNGLVVTNGLIRV